MPSVPHEMKKMWEEQVAPRLGMGGGGVLKTRTLKTVGIGESNVAEVVQDPDPQPEPDPGDLRQAGRRSPPDRREGREPGTPPTR